MLRRVLQKQNAIWVAPIVGPATQKRYGDQSDGNIPKAQQNPKLGTGTKFGFRVLPVGGYAQYPIKLMVTYFDEAEEKLVVVESGRWQLAPKAITDMRIVPNEVMALFSPGPAHVALFVGSSLILPCWGELQGSAAAQIAGSYEIHLAEFPQEVQPQAVEPVVRSFMLCQDMKLSNSVMTPAIAGQAAPAWSGAPLLTPGSGALGLIFVPGNASSLTLLFRNETGATRTVTKWWADNMGLTDAADLAPTYMRADADQIAVVKGSSEVEVELEYSQGAPQLLQLVSDVATAGLKVNAYVTQEL